MVCTEKRDNSTNPGAGTGGLATDPNQLGDSGEGGALPVDDGGNGAPDLPPGEWRNVTGNLAGKDSACGNLNSLFMRESTGEVIAGVARHGLWTSTSGSKWKALGTGAGSAEITNGPVAMVFDPENTAQYWESGTYGDGAGAYKTVDGGVTFSELPIDAADSISVDFSDPARKLLLAGSHEKPRMVFKSTDGGENWQNVGATLPADHFCTLVRILDSKTYLVGCQPGIYRTTDAARHWTQVSELGGSGLPLVASDGSIYWSSGDGQLLRSADAGQSWVELLPPNALVPVTPIELPDQRIAAISRRTLVVSANQGQTWDYASNYLPYENPNGLVYSEAQKAFFIWRWDCGQVVLSDAIMRFDFDYQAR